MKKPILKIEFIKDIPPPKSDSEKWYDVVATAKGLDIEKGVNFTFNDVLDIPAARSSLWKSAQDKDYRFRTRSEQNILKVWKVPR